MEKFAYLKKGRSSAVMTYSLMVFLALTLLFQLAFNSGVLDSSFGNGRDHPFGWQGRINVPEPGSDINVMITPVSLCCDFDRCTNCEPEYGAWPTLQPFPTFIPVDTPVLPTYVPTPVRDIPTRVPTPENNPPATPVPNPPAPTAFVLDPVDVVLDPERPPAPLTELDTGCFNFGNLDCGPFWVATPTPFGG